VSVSHGHLFAATAFDGVVSRSASSDDKRASRAAGAGGTD
jgi:hypothetical protein